MEIKNNMLQQNGTFYVIDSVLSADEAKALVLAGFSSEDANAYHLGVKSKTFIDGTFHVKGKAFYHKPASVNEVRKMKVAV